MSTINIYTYNNRSLKYINKKLTALKGETDSSTNNHWEFDTPLSIMDIITTRQNICKEAEDLDNIINQVDTMYRTLFPTTTEGTFFLSACRKNSKVYYRLVHKLSLNRFLKK